MHIDSPPASRGILSLIRLLLSDHSVHLCWLWISHHPPHCSHYCLGPVLSHLVTRPYSELFET